ncbi:phasin family protein [Methylomagnum sp.]
MRWNQIAAQTVERAAGNRRVYDQWFDFSRSVFEPVLRWNDIAFSAVEKVTRRNLNLAQDYMDISSRHINLLCDTKDPDKWRNEEGRLAAEFSQKMVDHAGDYLRVVQETQHAFNDWANEAAKQAAESAQRAVETTEKNATHATQQAAGAAKSGAAQQQAAAQPHRA